MTHVHPLTCTRLFGANPRLSFQSAPFLRLAVACDRWLTLEHPGTPGHCRRRLQIVYVVLRYDVCPCTRARMKNHVLLKARRRLHRLVRNNKGRQKKQQDHNRRRKLKNTRQQQANYTAPSPNTPKKITTQSYQSAASTLTPRLAVGAWNAGRSAVDTRMSANECPYGADAAYTPSPSRPRPRTCDCE